MDLLRFVTSCLTVLALMALSSAAFGQEPPSPSEEDRVRLRSLRDGHPRIIATEADFARAKRFVTEDALGKKWLEHLRAEAVEMLSKPPVEHVLVGPRLLSQSRLALNRIYTLALAYRLTGEKEFAERAVTEMLAAAAFEDWNPSHFLDTAEMTHALAIGYDWLYGAIGSAHRNVIARAIVDLGLKPSIDVYENQRWWAVAIHNWNQVCNGGMTIGALAVADREPEMAAYVVGKALQSVPRAMQSYAPDGAWPEGPAYWHYATRYNIYMIAALESALGSDFGLSKAEGFSETGRFMLYATGPTGRTFNFGDGGDGSGRLPELFWLARKFDDPVPAWEERKRAGDAGTPQDILWYDSRGAEPNLSNMPLDRLFRGVDVAFFRSAWNDPDALFVGFRAGNNRANHSHLDLGSFVLDALGERWAVDLGSDDYNLPGYWSPATRFNYFRLSTSSHNTITFDGANQDYTAKASMTAFTSSPNRAYAIADLSSAYAPVAHSVRRGVAMLDRKAILIQDEVRAADPVSPAWQMLTRAEVEISEGKKAILKIGGKMLSVEIVSPPDASFHVESAEQKPPQQVNAGVSRLTVRVASPASRVTTSVLITPGERTGALPESEPLDSWDDLRG